MHPEKIPTRAYPIPMSTIDSGRSTVFEGPTKRKATADRRAESINVTRLSTFFGKCCTIRIEVKKNEGQMAKKIPICMGVRLNSVNLIAKMGSIRA